MISYIHFCTQYQTRGRQSNKISRKGTETENSISRYPTVCPFSVNGSLYDLVHILLWLHILSCFVNRQPPFEVYCAGKSDIILCVYRYIFGRLQWPRGLRRTSAADRLLRSWVRVPPGHGCLSVVSVVCCQVEVSATSRSLLQRTVVCRV